MDSIATISQRHTPPGPGTKSQRAALIVRDALNVSFAYFESGAWSSWRSSRPLGVGKFAIPRDRNPLPHEHELSQRWEGRVAFVSGYSSQDVGITLYSSVAEYSKLQTYQTGGSPPSKVIFWDFVRWDEIDSTDQLLHKTLMSPSYMYAKRNGILHTYGGFPLIAANPAMTFDAIDLCAFTALMGVVPKLLSAPHGGRGCARPNEYYKEFESIRLSLLSCNLGKVTRGSVDAFHLLTDEELGSGLDVVPGNPPPSVTESGIEFFEPRPIPWPKWNQPDAPKRLYRFTVPTVHDERNLSKQFSPRPEYVPHVRGMELMTPVPGVMANRAHTTKKHHEASQWFALAPANIGCNYNDALTYYARLLDTNFPNFGGSKNPVVPTDLPPFFNGVLLEWYKVAHSYAELLFDSSDGPGLGDQEAAKLGLKFMKMAVKAYTKLTTHVGGLPHRYWDDRGFKGVLTQCLYMGLFDEAEQFVLEYYNPDTGRNKDRPDFMPEGGSSLDLMVHSDLAFTYALLMYRKHGPYSTEAVHAARLACKVNPHIPRILIGYGTRVNKKRELNGHGTETEMFLLERAHRYCSEIGRAWNRTSYGGLAVKWLGLRAIELRCNITIFKTLITKGGKSTRHTPRCWSCGKWNKIKLMKCAKCKTVKYCSRKCQMADWKAHKPKCPTY